MTHNIRTAIRPGLGKIQRILEERYWTRFLAAAGRLEQMRVRAKLFTTFPFEKSPMQIERFHLSHPKQEGSACSVRELFLLSPHSTVFSVKSIYSFSKEREGNAGNPSIC
jgi:hypothetical protein